MSLGTSFDTSKITRFAKQNCIIYLKECTSDGTPLTTGDGTVWTNLGTTKNTQIEPQTNDYKDNGDKGTNVVAEQIIERWEITTTLMQRDKPTRQLNINSINKYYQMVIVGQTIGTVTEVWGGLIKVDAKHGAYPIGGDAQFTNYKFSTIDNPSTLSITIPTAIGTATITIPVGQQIATDDV